MFIRSAYFTGRPVPGQEDLLHSRLGEVLQMYLGLPKIRAAQLLSAKDIEEGGPNLHATLQLCFDNEADLLAALATPYRQTLRTHFLEQIFPLFEGTVKHVNHAVQERVATA